MILSFSNRPVEMYKIDIRKITLYIFTFIFIYFSMYSRVIAKSISEADSLENKIDDIFKEWTSSLSPGGAVTIMKEGKVIFMKGYGYADIEMSIPITPSTKLFLASISKQFTGYCIAKLIIEEKLSLDDDIRKYIPEMFSFQKEIKIRDLVFQKSGLRDFLGLYTLTGFRVNDYLTNTDVLNVLYKQRELNFMTGDTWQYCNTNYFLLAEIVKRITGESIRSYAEKHIFKPLNMKNTTFVDSIETIIPDRAKSYHQNKDDSYWNDPFLDVTIGHSGLYSTAEDMSKWLIHFSDMINTRDPIFDLMMQNDTINNGEEINIYSFGLFKSSDKASKYWHRGSYRGFKSIITYYPEKDFGVVIMGNVQTFNRIRYEREITRLFHPESVPGNPTQTVDFAAMDSVKNKRIQIDTDLLKKYEGNYIVDTETVYVIDVRDNSLCMHEASSSRITPLIAVAENKFRDDESTILVSFIENNENIIEKMISQEASEKSTGEKEKPLTSAREAGIVGTYYNDELEFTVRIKKTDEGLAACNSRLGCFPIYPTSEDKFKCGHDFFSYISFYRNLNNDIEGFFVSGFFVSNIRFIKQGNY